MRNIDRRNLIAMPAAAFVSITQTGCIGLLGDIGGSSHVARRSAEIRPLVFRPESGLAAVNLVRRQRGLPAFTSDARLQQAAQEHADYMGRTGKYGHEFGPGTRFPVRIAAAGFDGSAGENIGVGYGSVEDAIEGWLDSPKHRKIMLRRGYDRAGIAYSFNRSGNNERYTHYWVLIVGREGRGAASMLQPV